MQHQEKREKTQIIKMSERGYIIIDCTENKWIIRKCYYISSLKNSKVGG